MTIATMAVWTLFRLAELLPRGARVIEMATVPRLLRADRAIVLWMWSAESRPRVCPALEEAAGSCPDQTRGCYLHGKVRVSLLDTSAGRIINTISVDDVWGRDAFDIPYKVLTPGPYTFDPSSRHPTILDLRDYNGDGTAAEFALFDAVSCSDMVGTLVGYSVARDRIMNFEVAVTCHYPGRRTDSFVTRWPEQLFNRKPLRPGFWQYTTAYPPGPPQVRIERWTVRYVAASERFEAECTTAAR